MKGRQIAYSKAELAWIKANATRPRREAHADFVDRFGRHDVSLQNFKALCKRKGWFTGRSGQFTKGQTPFNKGMKGFCAPGSEKGWFKKGQRPHNTKHLGHERVNVDGYVEVSIDEPDPHTGFERRYVLKHRHLWEQANGPLPDGHCLKCLDGDKTNCDPSNWEAIPRALLPRLAGGRWCKPFDQHEPGARPLVLATARLEHAAREAKRKAKT